MATLADFTPRELEILRLVVAGSTNRAIGTTLHISEKTVEFHLDHIYTKVGKRRRLTVGLWAMQHGLETDARDFPS